MSRSYATYHIRREPISLAAIFSLNPKNSLNPQNLLSFIGASTTLSPCARVRVRLGRLPETMLRSDQDRIAKLVKLIQSEQDSQTLLALMDELNQLLTDDEARKNVLRAGKVTGE